MFKKIFKIEDGGVIIIGALALFSIIVVALLQAITDILTNTPERIEFLTLQEKHNFVDQQCWRIQDVKVRVDCIHGLTKIILEDEKND